MKLYRLLIGLLIGRLLFAFSAYAANVEFFKDKDAPRPNILLIFIDDMGYADLSSYGSDLYQTPHIDNLAKEGILFTDAYASAPVCSPTRVSLLTGKYPARTNVTNFLPGHKRDNEKLKIPDWPKDGLKSVKEVTIGNLLQEAGYATAWLGKWHAGSGAQHCGFQAGNQNWKLNTGKDEKNPKGVQQLTQEALDFIKKSKEPFFVCISHYAVHGPTRFNTNVKKKYDALVKPEMRHKDTGYAAMVEALDDSVGTLMEGLKKLGKLDDTIIIFYSDNGGVTSRTDNYPMRDGKGTLYEGGVRVPFIVRMPGGMNGGTVSHEVITSPDLLPTFLEVARAGDKAPANIDGISILNHLVEGSKIDRDAVYWHFPHYHSSNPVGSVRSGNFKLLEYYEDGKLELYDLANDISETKNLAAAMPDKAKELRDKLHAWRKSVDAQMPTTNPNYAPKN